MLTIDPTKRISIEDCLKHPFFDDVIEKGHNLRNFKAINIHFEDELQHELEEKKMRSLFLDEFKIANSETE
jgi:spore coat polysaccharide biosynthesis predicted glycosyltransferase SpsG